MAGRLVYSTLASLDGYVADEAGNFDWAAPDEEVHTFINDVERQVGTHLYGRRMYETMVAWETMDQLPDEPECILDYARIWQRADKIVYSRSLTSVSSARTRIERDFDPHSIRRMKAEARTDLGIGGAELAAVALREGLVDEYRVFVAPAIVGGGKQALPSDVKVMLELRDERRFKGGMVYLAYALKDASTE